MNLKEFQAAYPGLLTEQGLAALTALHGRLTADPVALVNQALCAHAGIVTPRQLNAAGRKPNYTGREIVDMLTRVYRESGVFPTIAASGSWNTESLAVAAGLDIALPDQSTIRRKLGSLKVLKQQILAELEAAQEPVKANAAVKLPERARRAANGYSEHTNKLAYQLARFHNVYGEWPAYNQVDWLPLTLQRAELVGLTLIPIDEARERFGSLCKLFDVAEKLRRCHRRNDAITGEDALDALLRARNLHGFWPAVATNEKWSGLRGTSKWLPSPHTYLRLFGSMGRARELAEARAASLKSSGTAPVAPVPVIQDSKSLELLELLWCYRARVGAWPVLAPTEGKVQRWSSKTLELAQVHGLELPLYNQFLRKVGGIKSAKKSIEALITEGLLPALEAEAA